MAGDLFSHLVRLELLEAVRPDLLRRFLRPFESFLSARSVPLDGTSASGPWLAQLHDVLNTVDREVPPELQQALVDIADLTSDGAHEHVLAIAKNERLELFDLHARTTPEDLAFDVYLNHPDLFRTAHARTQSAEVRRFVEFYAKDDTPLEGHLSAVHRVRLAGVLGAWFQERNRTAFCDVRVTEAGPEVSFVIIHGRPPRNHGAIESDDRRTRVTYVPDKHDVLVFDRTTGRLEVNAQFAGEQDFYRRALGRVFWDDDDHFVARAVYTGEPLVDEGSAVLDTHGVPGLAKVTLREVKIVSRGEVGGVLAWRARDLGAVFDTPLGKHALLYGDVVQFQLAMALTARARPVRVDVHVPNNLSYDRRVGGDVVREYLLESGFMQLPAAADGGAPAAGAA